MRFLLFLFLAFGNFTMFSQSYWHTTRDFPGGSKTSLAGCQDTVLLVGTDKGIWQSANEGYSWNHALVSTPIYSVHASESGKVIAGGVGKVFFSLDKGITWDSLKLDTSFPIKQLIRKPTGEYLAATGILDQEGGYIGDGVFFNDGISTGWEKRNNGIPEGFHSVDYITNDHHGRIFAAVADENTTGTGGLFMSENNGLQWEPVNLTVDGTGAIGGVIHELITLSLTVTPQDTLIVTMSGISIGSGGVNMNLKKNVNDLKGNSHWKVMKVLTTPSWWDDFTLEAIHFSKAGHWYSSLAGSVNKGGTMVSLDQGMHWQKANGGLGLSTLGTRTNQFFYESSEGKIFMVQFLDERVYWTDKSILNPVIISGKIIDDQGTSIPGVALTVENTVVFADHEGVYSFVVPKGWSGTITPTRSLYVFEPDAILINGIQSSIQLADIVGEYTGTYVISGYVYDVGSNPVSGIVVTGFPQPVITNEYGFFSAEVPTRWSGILNAEREGYNFKPGPREITDVRSDIAYQNFVIRKNGSVYITGRVQRENGDPFWDVQLDGFPEDVRVNANGEFVAEVPEGWSGTIVPSFPDHRFHPEQIQITAISKDLTHQNFSASYNGTYSLKGRIVDGAGSPVANVFLAGLPPEVRTDADGFYQADLPRGWSGTITPQSETHTFIPAAISIDNLDGPVNNQNFQATVITGIGEDFPDDVQVYPNPSYDRAVHLRANHFKPGDKITITNSSGDVVHGGTLGELGAEGKIEFPSAGLYFISLSNQRAVITRKVAVF